jgi:hypothetical protein
MAESLELLHDVFLYSVAFVRRTIQVCLDSVLCSERYAFLDSILATQFYSKSASKTVGFVLFLQKAFCKVHRWHPWGFRGYHQGDGLVDGDSKYGNKIVCLSAWQQMVADILHMFYQSASRFSSIIRLIRSDTVMPNRLASSWSHLICGAVRTTDCFAEWYMGFYVAPNYHPVKETV